MLKKEQSSPTISCVTWKSLNKPTHAWLYKKQTGASIFKEKPACATIVKSWLIFFFFPLEHFRDKSVFFHGEKNIKWQTTTSGYKYFVYKYWKQFWEVVFKDSFLIENGFKKTGENSFLSPGFFVQRENILWGEKRGKKGFVISYKKAWHFFNISTSLFASCSAC